MSDLKIEFRVDTTPVFLLLRRLRLAIDPAVLARIIYEEGQAFVLRAREILLSRSGKFEQYVTGDLYSSVRFDVIPGIRAGVLKGKFWVDCPYADAVEYKTPRRTTPPTKDEIIAWKRAKVGHEGLVGGIKAWNHIKKHGVKNHPFFWPAYRELKLKVMLNINNRVLALIKDPSMRGITARPRHLLSRRKRHVSISLRALLYKWARILGWMQALGLDVSAIRAFMYATARGIGDASAVQSGAIAGRMARRGAGGITSVGIGAGVPQSDPLLNRAYRVGAGRLAGPSLRGMF